MKCLKDHIIIEYIENNYLHKHRDIIEEHFFQCKKCSEKSRLCIEINSITKVLNAKKQNKKYNKTFDSINLAAASSQNPTTAMIKSANGKYILKLVPFIDKNTMLVEVKVSDNSLKGTIVVENAFGIILESKLSNGIACDEVNNNIDFRNVLISIKE